MASNVESLHRHFYRLKHFKSHNKELLFQCKLYNGYSGLYPSSACFLIKAAMFRKFVLFPTSGGRILPPGFPGPASLNFGRRFQKLVILPSSGERIDPYSVGLVSTYASRPGSPPVMSSHLNTEDQPTTETSCF
jgi:hypothetical protein